MFIISVGVDRMQWELAVRIEESENSWLSCALWSVSAAGDTFSESKDLSH
jgi:hypothetical protein